mgnify:CR=1 FL=1
MLLKIILLGIGVWLVYLFFVKYNRSIRPPQTPTAAPEEDMVRCAQCSVHLPKSESILSGGEFFCSQEHRRLRQDKTEK